MDSLSNARNEQNAMNMKKTKRKRVVCLLAACLLLAGLSGCITIKQHHSGLQRYGISPVRAVYLYDVQDDEVSSMGIHDFAYLEAQYTPIAALDEAEREPFCTELQALRYTDEIIIFPPMAQDPNFDFKGRMIWVEYENGDCELVSWRCCAFREGGAWENVTGVCETEEWDALLQTYFPEAVS